MSFQRILIVGSGNVAWHFSKMLASHTDCDLWVYARNGQSLADFHKDNLNPCIIDVHAIPEDIDLTILAVNDDSIEFVSKQHPWPGLVVHTSGTVTVSAIHQVRKGVVWTLQSLKKNQETNYQNIPFFIQASSEKDTSDLNNLLCSISSTIYMIDDEQRLKVHLSAVIANNFSNHLYQIAHEILSTTSVSFDVLLPIIEEETRKIKTMNPYDIQTGPARRGDMKTIEKHTHLLASDPESLAIYQSLTKRILKAYGHDQL
jgi:predicted short-subunit dehydrogenase-like oxidoreductase (DUF2520 family)